MRWFAVTALLITGCPTRRIHEQGLQWPEWVVRAYAPLDDRVEILSDSMTRHTSTRMACAGTYSCLVGWRGSEPDWIECEVETHHDLWSCIHFQQARPRFRFYLANGRIVSWISLTPWIEASLDRIASGFGDWNPFQVCGGEWTSKGEYILEVMGGRDDEEMSVRSVTTVLGVQGSWVTRE